MVLQDSLGRRVALVGLFVAMGALVDTSAAEDTVPNLFKEASASAMRESIEQHPSEQIDPYSGALSLSVTDVSLPGNGGLDLSVVRSYSSNRVNPEDLSDPSNLLQAGLGWSIHFGRVLLLPRLGVADPCSNPGIETFRDQNGQPVYGPTLNDNPVLELPDGSRQVFAFTGASPALLTSQRWRADCTGNAFSVYSPGGLRYDMTQYVAGTVSAIPGPIFSGQRVSAASWFVTKITDRNGNFIAVNYVAPGSPEISSATASDGRTIAFSYLDAGLPSRRVGSVSTGGRTWTYGYQFLLNQAPYLRYCLTSVVRPDSPGAAGSTWGYGYQTGSFYLPSTGLLTTVVHPQGGGVSYAYNWVTLEEGSSTVSKRRSPGVSAKSTSDGASWAFVYLSGSSIVATVSAPSPDRRFDTTTVTTPTGVVVYKHLGTRSNEAWSIGLLVEKRVATVQTETYSWSSQKIGNEFNRRLAGLSPDFDRGIFAPILAQRTVVRDGASYTTAFSNHDAYGNPLTISESGPNGARTTNLSYYIDTALWIVKQVANETTVDVGAVTRAFDVRGNLISETRDGGRRGATTGYTRTSEGDIATMISPRGFVSTFTNYYRGTPQSEAHPEGVNITRVVSEAGNVTSETNGELKTSTFGYDGLNRLTTITPALGNRTTIAYTANTKTATRGTLQQVETVDGFGRTTNVNTAGQAVAATYDAMGRKTFGSIVGYPSVGHSFQYDALNRVTRITHNADASYRSFVYSSAAGVPTLSVRDERGYVTTHAYRAFGDPDRQELMGIAAPVAAANVSITRNGRGLVTNVTQAGISRTFDYDVRYYLVTATHPETGRTGYGRDIAGNMTTKQVGASGITTYDYDGRNRVMRVTYPGGSPSTVTNTYTRTDKLKTVSNAVATRTYGYDNNQNLKTESLVVDGLTLAATYNYNANDQLSSIVYPVLSRTVNFNPDVLGRPTSIVPPAGAMLNASFWPNGQIYDIAFSGGSRATYGQNTREWLNSVTVKTGDGVSRIASTLTHDVAGNLISVADSVDAAYNRTLGHDGINRLVTAYGSWGTGSMGYDGAGNLTLYTLNNTNRVNTYDPATNRMTNTRFETAGVINSQTSYAYDAYGNASPASDSYTYDNASNLTTSGAGRLNAYDGANSRVKTVAGGVTTYEFRSAHGLLLAEWRKQSGYYDILKEHLHLAGKEVAEQQTNFLGATTQPVTWLFLQPDANGSPIASTWAGGGLLFKESYQPYGSQINGTAAGYTQRAFAGHRQDKPDLIYMGARYYNPMVGRFLSIDPKEADPSDLHSLNRYAYANNNPYRYVDPDGYTPVDLFFFAVDAAKLGMAIYKGEGVAEAAVDIGLSAVGVMSPVPGAGQALKTLRVAEKVAVELKAADKVVEAATASRRVANNAEVAGVAKETGSYTNLHESGRTYSGKGSRERSQISGRRVENETGDPHIATDWRSSKNRREAFKDESRRIDENGAVSSSGNYNKIESPGKGYRAQDGE